MLLWAASVMATNIIGRVVETGSGAPMPYVTISLMTTDSVLINGTITDEKGSFSLEYGGQSKNDNLEHHLILSASYIGYRTEYRSLPLTSPSIRGPHGTDSVGCRSEGAWGCILLTEETEQLAELEVKAHRPLIERQMDKLVMNVSASPFAIGSNGQDVLKRAPGVRIDKDGNITVNGKSVEVYIDGRPSYLSGEQLKGLLQGTAGASIEKIEIITNPSAKYDASGQGGIINIRLKKNMMKGFNGMLAANYGGMYFKNPNTNNTSSTFLGKGAQRAGKGAYYQNEYVALNLNYRSEKTYTAISLTQVYANQGVEFSSYSQQPVGADTLRLGSDLHYDLDYQYYNLRASNDWYIDERNTLGVILNVPIMKTNMDAQSVGEYCTYTMLNDMLLNKSLTNGQQSMFSPQHSANLNYTHTFADSCAQELTANLDYNRFRSHSLNRQRNQDIETVPGYESLPGLDITTNQIVNIYSAKLDFQSAFCKKGFVETGMKYALSQTDNEMTTDSIFPSPLGGSRRGSGFAYSEHVAALYLTASWQFNEKFSLKAGLRGEYTYGIGDWKMEGVENYRNSRFDLFPTAFIGYNPGKDWRLSASYTRRIKRPSYYQLNPFRNYVNAHAYQEGNPKLQPEFNNQVDLTVGWSQYISLAANFAHTEEMMHMKGEIMPNGDMCSRWMNFGTCTTHGVNVSFTEIPIIPKKTPLAPFGERGWGKGAWSGAWLALTFNAGYYNFISRASDGSYVQRSHYANCNGTLTAYLPEDIQIAVDGWYSAPMTIGYQYTCATGAMGLAFKKTFPKQQLTLSLGVNDLLRSTRFRQEDKGLDEGYKNYIQQEVHQQNINIGLTYMFGQYQHVKYRRVGNTDESARLGGGGGVGK